MSLKLNMSIDFDFPVTFLIGCVANWETAAPYLRTTITIKSPYISAKWEH